MMSDQNNNKLGEFLFEGAQVRVCGSADAPLFVAKDVCLALSIKNNRDVIASLEDYEKGVEDIDTLGGVQRLAVLTESGLYHLIFKSRKAVAKKFRRWVTEEVLPELRRVGFFSVIGDRELVTLPAWLEEQGVDLRKNKLEAKRLLKNAWEASKLLGYREKQVDERSGLVVFPGEVLDLAGDPVDGLFLGMSEESGACAARVLEGMEVGKMYSVMDVARLAGMSGKDNKVQADVAVMMGRLVGKSFDGARMGAGKVNRRRYYVLTREEGA